MSKQIEPFYIETRHLTLEEAGEVLDRAVANGADQEEGVEDYHSVLDFDEVYYPKAFQFIGISSRDSTYFGDTESDFKGDLMTLDEVRKKYRLPDEKKDLKKYTSGDKVWVNFSGEAVEGEVIAERGEGYVVEFPTYDEGVRVYKFVGEEDTLQDKILLISDISNWANANGEDIPIKLGKALYDLGYRKVEKEC